MKLKRILAMVLVLTMSVVTLTACGGNEGDNPSGGTAVETPADNTDGDGDETVDGVSSLDKIRDAGKLVMLTNAAFPPFEYLGSNNKVVGVDADIAAEIAKEIGVELEIVDMDFDGIPMAISSGQGDIGAAGITAREDRRQVVDFSINYVETTQLIIVQEDNGDILTPDDLEGKNIGVQLGTTGDLFASEIESANIVRFKTGPDAGLALANGQVDCVVIDAMPATMIVGANSNLVLLSEPFTEEEYAIAIAKGNDDLREVVDRVLTRMLEEGAIDALIEQHMAELED